MFDLKKECTGAKKIGISGHIRPDGDCVGSTMGLALYLRKVFPETQVDVLIEQPADIFACIKDVDTILQNQSPDVIYDVFFALDCSKDRLGEAQTFFEQAKKKINIDHHISNLGCAEINYVVPTASSTSELVYDLLEENYIDAEIAKAIYIGIIHDTGVFQYSNTLPKTLNIAAKLISYGFDFSQIIDETFYEKTYVQTQILGRAILESILFLDGRCAVSCVDKKMMEFYGVTPKDLDGIVNQLRMIKHVDCAIFMYQTENLEYKVSMRSNDKVDVSKIATFFGGGGHKKAAGCTMQGTFHDVINNLSSHIEKELKENASD